MSSDDTSVHMFWHGEELPPLAHACMQSFVSRGHRVHVHAYEPLALPGGVERNDARDVIADDDPVRPLCRMATVTTFADCFRYALLQKRGGWWVDTDVFCLTDRLPDDPRAWAQQEPGVINNAILKFPVGDPLCARLSALARERATNATRWGALGPDLATEVLGERDGFDPARLREAFYPIHWNEAYLLWLPECRAELERRLERAQFLHCWAQALARMHIDTARTAPAGSLLGDLLRDAPGMKALGLWHQLRARRGIALVRRRQGSRPGPAAPGGASRMPDA